MKRFHTLPVSLFCIYVVVLQCLHASAQAPSTLRVNAQRIHEHLSALSKFGANPQGGVSRVAYSDADLQGRNYAISLMKQAGLDVHIDASGNIVGTRAGSDASLKPLLIGSHIDSVPMGGNYDGDVGSLSAIEVAHVLQEKQITLRHPLEVIIFQNEEGGTVGSQALGEGLDEKHLNLVSNSGKTIREGTRIVGGDPERLVSARRQPGSIAGYFELHIEQGGTLEREKIDIGVVEGIVGNGRWDVTIDGFANHAGSTPMNQRHDALLAGAKFIEAVNRIVTSIPGRQVGTVGKIQAIPGAYNVVPGRVVLGLDVRDLDQEKIDTLFSKMRNEAEQIGQASGTKFSFHQVVADKPALTDPRLRQIIADAAKQLNLSTKLLPSGATHDAQSMARLAPVGMIFVPSIGGISHSPEEFSRPQDIVNGANVLLGAVQRLDSQNW